jgi:hypothetical protein
MAAIAGQDGTLRDMSRFVWAGEAGQDGTHPFRGVPDVPSALHPRQSKFAIKLHPSQLDGEGGANHRPLSAR